MNQNTFNEKLKNLSKEFPNIVFDIVTNPVKESCDVRILTKDNYEIAWINFSYNLYALNKPAENLSELVTNLEYEFTGFDTRISAEEIEIINKIKESFKEN